MDVAIEIRKKSDNILLLFHDLFFHLFGLIRHVYFQMSLWITFYVLHIYVLRILYDIL